MSAWKEWCSIEVEDGKVFPKLRTLSILNCERLGTIDLPRNLPCLPSVLIEGSKDVLCLSFPRTLASKKLGSGKCEKTQLQYQQHWN